MTGYTTSQAYGDSMFGMATALDAETAVVGAFNRDTYVTGTNSGSAFVFNLNFLDLAFSASTYAVTEGSSLAVDVYRCGATGTDCFFGPM